MAKSNGIYEFGPFRLDAGARRLYRDSVPVTLTPKCFDLLLVLVERRGQALSKAELLETVWPDVEVEEGNLTFQMAALRKALGPEAAGWIETVSRFGYLFSAPVTERRAVDSDVDPIATHVKSTKLRRRFAVTVVAVAVVLLVGVLLSARVRSTPQPLITKPFTGLPGDETAPSISRDGKDVAFLWNGPERDNWDVYVKSEGVEEPLRFTATPEPECCAKWSPDGRRIAFGRRATDDLVDIIVKPYPDGPERKIGQARHCYELGRIASRILDWHPDGDHLVIAGLKPGENCGLSFLSVSTGRVQPLTVQPRPSMMDTSPAVSPDGRMVAFVRGPVWPSFLIYTLEISAELKPVGAPRPLTVNGETEMWPAWLPGSDAIVFTGGASLTETALFRAAVPGPSEARRIHGVDALPYLASISAGGRLVYATRPARGATIHRLEIPPAPGTQPVETEFAPSTYTQQMPVYSPDGKLVAFESERTGSREIWLSAANGTQLRRLTHFNGPPALAPNWSPDGTRIGCSVAFRDQRDMFIVDVNHGTSTRLTNTPYDEGSMAWSPDGNWIYYASSQTGRSEIWRMPSKGGEGVQLSRNGGAMPRPSVDGKFIYYKRNTAPTSICRIAAGGGPEEVLAEGINHPAGFALAGDGVYYFTPNTPFGQQSSSAGMLRFRHSATGRIDDVLTVSGVVWWGFDVSRDGRTLLFSRAGRSMTDLRVADGVR